MLQNINTLADPRQWNWKSRLLAIGACVLATAVGTGDYVWNQFDHAGDINIQYPIQKQNGILLGPPNAVGWNMENKVSGLISELRQLDAEANPSAIVIQEGNVRSANALRWVFQDHYITSIITDAKRNVEGGGQALLIITKNKPRDIRKIVFDGPSYAGTLANVAQGFGKDFVATAMASPSIKNMQEGIRESRVTVAFTMTAQLGGEVQDVRYITGHVTPLEADRESQVNADVEFIKQDMKSGLPTVVCMDWNTDPGGVVPKLDAIGLITQRTTKTSIHGRTIDFCSYSRVGFDSLKSVSVRTKNMKGSDHFPLEIVFGDRAID